MSIADAEEAMAFGRGLLRGERVRLRPLREEDLGPIGTWWEDPEQQALQQPAVRPRPDGAGAEAFRRWSANTDGGSAGFSVETRDSAELVGHVVLFGAVLPERAGRLAVIIGPHAVGRGYGSDAVRVMVRYGFLAMGLNRIQLEVFGFNTRARRAYARAGFTEEGVRREAAWIDGGFADEVLMSVLRREWDASRE